MQKSIVVSTPEAEFSALAFKEEFKDSIKKVNDLGFDAVELAIKNPNTVNTDKIKEIVSQYNLPVVALGTGQAYGEEGLSFTDPAKEIREKAVNRIKAQMDFAEFMGDPVVIIGLIRGKMQENISREQAETYFIKCMEKCADYNQDITLVIEPINRYETDLYNDLLSTKKVVKKINKTNVNLMIDTFHMNIEDADMLENLREVKDYLAHVHLADSNRWAPGCGHIDFESIISTLKDIGYEKALSAEILPEPDPDKSAEMTINYLEKLGL